ncbi:hypothetical protein CCUS01_15531 [Colletotrichum cuscutae]|uniref:Uncharacterized protein n=1 Tax=Colletotrichum cuscutae TaxID=1209917 RepID=A0AAI9VH63_9PEZI|nr:hypothetical protein CCUS01_15531 [Colletotrichum cuscutae]
MKCVTKRKEFAKDVTNTRIAG